MLKPSGGRNVKSNSLSPKKGEGRGGSDGKITKGRNKKDRRRKIFKEAVSEEVRLFFQGVGKINQNN